MSTVPTPVEATLEPMTTELFSARVLAELTGMNPEAAKHMVTTPVYSNEASPGGVSADVAKFNPAAIMMIVEAIMNIIAMISENCPERRQLVESSRVRPVQRAWLRARFVRPNMPRKPIRSNEGRQVGINEMTDALINTGMQASPQEKQQILLEYDYPDFGVV